MQTAFFTKSVALALDLEKQLQLTHFKQKLVQNALFTKSVVLAVDFEKHLQLTQF